VEDAPKYKDLANVVHFLEKSEPIIPFHPATVEKAGTAVH
jgi:hypothetical protein